MIEGELNQIESRLQQIVDAAGPEVNEVGGYIFNGTGKRIRPALFLLAAYKPGSDLRPYLDAAVVLELLHTASLLHDDVIDQASVRRGRETVHVKWNNKISVLTGDYLLSQAFGLLVGYQDWRLMDVVVNIVRNMTEGEIEQAFADTGSSRLEEYYFKWIGKKSASFFAGCCQAGCIVSGGNGEQQSGWSEFGYNLGIAFQLIDDLLDYTGEDKVTGKPRFGDLHNRVVTLPLIRTLDYYRGNDSFNRMLRHETDSKNRLSEVAQAVLESDGPDYTYRKAEEYSRLARGAIKRLDGLDENVKMVLEEITRDVLSRKQ